MGKYIAGDDLKAWSARAKSNSNHPGHRGDAKEDPGLKDEWRQPQKKEEGRCWTKDSETPNTYTGKGGSKRD